MQHNNSYSLCLEQIKQLITEFIPDIIRRVRIRISNYSNSRIRFGLQASITIAEILAFAAVAAAAAPVSDAQSKAGAPGFATYGEPKYPADFTHFEYANPSAPKGCTVRLSGPVRSGSFDSFNPFIVKGHADLGAYFYVYETLMTASEDEIGIVYPRLAMRMNMSADNRRVIFHLDPRASWHDGKPVLAEDVAFTVDTLRRHGRPGFRASLRRVTVHVIDARTVAFDLPDEQPRSVAVDIANLRILPKHDWENKDFDRTTLDPPLGSGPYRVAEVRPGRSVTYERVANYWGRDLPTMRGRYNYQRIVNEYFFHETTRFEAFLRGHIDIHIENDPRRWRTGYDVPPVLDGRIQRVDLRNWFTIGMNGFFFNLRQARFRDIRMRRALELLFDYEWVNRNIFHGAYRRTGSYFENSTFAAHSPPGPAELRLMREYLAVFPPQALTDAWRPTVSDGTGFDRANVRAAVRLLAEAGWTLRDGRMINASTGEPLTFEVLAQTRSQEKILSHYFSVLRRVGIDARLKVVDAAAYVELSQRGEFDLIYRFLIQPPWPGPEQRRAWASTDPYRPGANLIGLENSDIDALVERVVSASDVTELTISARVLDRALQWGAYAIPGFHDSHRRVAFWSRFQRPKVMPKYGWGLDYWWCRDAESDGRPVDMQ